jgi:hypothetical protein
MLIQFKTGRALRGLTENESRIEGHLEAASIHHEKAVQYLSEGEYEKAAQNAIIAKQHLDLASEIRRDEVYAWNTKSA